MSSNLTDGNIYGGKLLIHIAENGHSYELDCGNSTVIKAVQRSIESMAGIQFNDQLLLCGDMKLESNEVLGAYKLPSDEQEVFCYNKSRLQPNAEPPPPEQIDIHVVPVLTSPSSNHDPHPLDNVAILHSRHYHHTNGNFDVITNLGMAFTLEQLGKSESVRGF